MAQKFTVYRSSAGSGKTHTLVKEYIRLALSEPRNTARFAKILAITFTNKAAGEMKERVMDNLFTLQVPAGHAHYKQWYLDEMADFCKLSPQEVQLRAGRVFKTMLHNYHLLKITTIDKFTVSLVYSFARDLGIDADHEIVTDKDEVIEAGVRTLVDQSGRDEELTKIFLNFLGKGIEEGDRFNIKKELKNFCSKVLDEKGYKALAVASDYSEHEFLEAHRLAADKVRAIQKQVENHAQTILALFEQAGITEEDLYQKGSGNLSWIKKVNKGGFEEIEFSPRIKEFVEDDKKRLHKTADAHKQEAFSKIETEVVKRLKALLDLKQKEYSHYLIHDTVKNHAFSMALFKRMQVAIEEYKTTNGIILLSEFTKLVSDIVAKEPAPFIYERLGERVKNIFVDEFQDTSSLQFSNLVPLMENSLSTGDFVMVVGDAKQSIYRWRNGNVEQFIDLPALPANSIENHPFRQKIFNGEMHEEKLPKNYRSMEKVVQFNNDFFEALLNTEEYSDKAIQQAYKDVRQYNREDKPGGYVDFLVNYEKKEDLPGAGEEEEDAKKEIEATLSWIKQSVANGYSYGDIAILVRQHKDGEKIFNGLRRHNIPVVSNQAMGLSGSDELKTINALFACLHEISSITRLKQFTFLLAKTRNVLHEYESMVAGLQGKRGSALLVDIFKTMGIRFSLKFFYTLNLYEQVYYIIYRLGFNKENAFITTYLELVFEFFRKNGSNAVMFINWWANNSGQFKLQTGSGGKSVQIVTIHQSKGLQYPVVILPFVSWKARQSDKYFWLYEVPHYQIKPLPVPLSQRLNDSDWRIEHELENMRSSFDVINMLYVAFTRAEDQLMAYVDASSSYGLGKQIAQAIDTLAGYARTARLMMGEPVVRKKAEEKNETAEVVKPLVDEEEKFVPWHHKLLVSAHFLEKFSDESPALRKGILVHEIFSGIRQPADIDPRLEKFVKQGLLTDVETTDLQNDLGHLLHSPEYSLMAKDALQLPEVEVFDGESRVYRPDRIFMYANGGVSLLDLKTGDEDEKHRKQVKNYAGILEKSGYRLENAFVYYVKTKKWIKV